MPGWRSTRRVGSRGSVMSRGVPGRVRTRCPRLLRLRCWSCGESIRTGGHGGSPGSWPSVGRCPRTSCRRSQGTPRAPSSTAGEQPLHGVPSRSTVQSLTQGLGGSRASSPGMGRPPAPGSARRARSRRGGLGDVTSRDTVDVDGTARADAVTKRWGKHARSSPVVHLGHPSRGLSQPETATRRPRSVDVGRGGPLPPGGRPSQGGYTAPPSGTSRVPEGGVASHVAASSSTTRP
jgi:hypothetical protein